MVTITLDLVLFLNILYVSYCARRIKDGSEVSTDKRYIVYLVKAPKSDKLYDAWVCGGAIVNSYFIITSAACVDDVEYMYAIAGYNYYVKDNELERNKCTKAKKKKIIYICVPRSYELEYDKLAKWSLIDIALAKVESPYDFADQSYKTLCSYIPTWIPINYEDRFQEPGTDGLVLGWGHTNKWREPSDSTNYNAYRLRYASTRILDKERCKANYAKFQNMGKIIDKYMICTLEKGELDEKGQIVYVGTPPPKLEGCEGGLKLLSYDNELCYHALTRREVIRSNPSNDSIFNKNDTNIETNNKIKDSNINKNDFIIETKNQTLLNQTNESRKSGICQNDHGGPLVTWVGAREVLIGIASVFRVSDDHRCMGPYLYTSTQCNGAFLDCILSNSALPNERNRRAICDSPPIQRGFDTVERNISWIHHPAGPAANEVSASEKKFEVDTLSPKQGLVDRLNTKAGLARPPKALERLMKFGKFWGNETVAIRPQRPLEQN